MSGRLPIAERTRTKPNTSQGGGVASSRVAKFVLCLGLALALSGCMGMLDTSGDPAAEPETDTPTNASANMTNASEYSATYLFESEAADVGIPERFDELTDPRSRGQSRLGVDEVANTTAYQGIQSYHGAEDRRGNVLFIRPEDQPLTSPRTANVSVALRRTDQYTDPNHQGKAGIALYEQTGGEPNVRLHLRADRLTPKSSWTTITDVTTGDWVHVTIFDIDPENNTYAVEWETRNTTGVMRNIQMNAPMDEGYRNTVLSIDQEGYADALRLERPSTGEEGN